MYKVFDGPLALARPLVKTHLRAALIAGVACLAVLALSALAPAAAQNIGTALPSATTSITTTASPVPAYAAPSAPTMSAGAIQTSTTQTNVQTGYPAPPATLTTTTTTEPALPAPPGTLPAATTTTATAVTVPPVITPNGTVPGVTATKSVSTTVPATTASGINLPSPPPATAFSTNPDQLSAEAQQAAIQAQAVNEQAQREQEHVQRSYDRASSGLLPMTPDQIRTFMHKLENTQEAAQPPSTGAPKGQVRIATLSLDPGVEPPQVNLAAGYVTTIAMVDATGEPWPILDVGVGGNFEVSPTPAGSHVVRVMPLTRFGDGNLSVLLKDLPTPVIFRLYAGGPSVDLRYDARIGRPGPGARMPIIDRPHLLAGDETITMILENSPPKGALRLKVGGLDARTKAWAINDKVYVRTPLALLSPAWNASAASADGTTVYEIGDAPVLLMSDNGAMVRAQISRDDDHDK